MSVGIRRQRDGTLRPFWYGEHVEDGKRKVLNVGEWRGTPPASLLGTGDGITGDAAFEASRKEAEATLKGHAKEAGRKGRVEHLTERLIESKTGRAMEYVAIADLPNRWRNLGRQSQVSEPYLKGCDTVFNRFAAFMQARKPGATNLYEVTAKDASTHVTELQVKLAQKTVRDAVKLLNKSFERFLPVGGVNPFAGFVGRRTNGESETIHRKPFTSDELKALLAAASNDAFMHPLVVTAACTGMRRGDVCGLKWADVDLAEGMLAVKTAKTGAQIEIPIFKPLRTVLEERQGNGGALVFPEAARMLKENPDGLTWRFKKIVAQAFAGDAQPPALPVPVPAADIETDVAAAIARGVPGGDRRDRILEVFRRYCAGASLRQIVTATGYCKATVSNDLHAVQDMAGKHFLRVQTTNVKKAVRETTQIPRARGQRAASVRDWHALRATFVTLALSAGVPIELVRRATGHATTEIVLKYYFHPGREQFRAALTGALPDVLTGDAAKKRLTTAEELAALAAKLAEGSATKEDKSRFRKLAAKV